ncbi:MAG TPA: hypothetical protein VHL58_20380 [Thermoanaerobaculia bacterium]|nr:hypothetical protein [Thermoanaerobaculia bacterium]
MTNGVPATGFRAEAASDSLLHNGLMDPVHNRGGTALPDRFTVIAIGLVAYSLANLLHEGAGHGGVCVLLGGKPLVLSSVHFECDEGAMSASGQKMVSAAGSMVNYLAAAISLVLMRLMRNRPGPVQYFLWLFTTINLLMAAGYFLFSGLGNIGDWAAVCNGLVAPVVWRPLLALIGGVLYFLFARRAAIWLRPFAGSDALQRQRATRLTMLPYLAGGLLYCVSGFFNPVGPILIAISAAAASFGGASGLIWLKEFLRAENGAATPLVEVPRSIGWILAGIVSAALFIGVLGPAIRF